MNDLVKRHKRKEIFSNPAFQVRIVLVFLVLAVLFIATHCYVVRALLQSTETEIGRLPLPPTARTDISLILEQQAHTLDLQLGLLTFLTVFVLLMGGILLSHRIGGPLYQLRTYLDAASRDATPPRRIAFRKGDFLHDLAASFNRFQEQKGILEPAEDPAGEG